jgi:hypothetical protein
MTDSMLGEIDRTVAWMAFGDESTTEGLVINPNEAIGYRATRRLPSYASDAQAAQGVIDHFEQGGATVTFARKGDGWHCEFVPSPDDAEGGWGLARATATTRPLALCVAVLRASGPIPEEHGRMSAALEEYLRQGRGC